ncbi:PKD domain-containing protein [Flavihumibacter profundi]|uniref:PKD domain-containing protein n=1 Tax=Flavihumibacter profundi TaxID=2716883 RepID=UPI001CC4433F|nr:PKD domain-containing protein [Flavihumibacter profundi]MBZ5855762.1 tandem-95 repeat protein [Flavihumibacter profundi]
MKTFVAALMLLAPFLGSAQSWKVFSMNDANPKGSSFQGEASCCSYSMTNNSSIKRFGNQSLRVELNKSDGVPTDGSGSHRSEKYYNYSGTKSGQNGDIKWYAFSMYSPASSNSNDPAEEIRFQLHSNIGSPPLSLQVVNGNWRVSQRNSSNGGNPTFTTVGPVMYDQWEDWIIYFDDKQDASGSIKVWRNDVLVYSYTGVTNYVNSTAIYAYPKIGVYKYPWSQGWNPASTSTTRVFYIDSVFYGNSSATYANMDVTPSGSTPPTANQAPVANAGADQFITLPTNSVTLNGGNSSDADGSITSYKWSQVSGPGTAVFANANAASTAASSLVQGTYVFRLTVTDNQGATGINDITVSVGSSTAIANVAPVANAGTAKTITLPTNSTSLSGSGTDADGTISAYKWTQVSGPGTATFSSTTTAAITVSALVAGTYNFKLTVTDNKGATASANVSVTVNTATTANIAPVANAGANKSITLPTNSTGLSGTGTDADGTISAYKWSQVSGPNTATFSSTVAAAITVSNLVAGTYSFKLTVTDNKGATGSATVSVTVGNATVANKAPVVNAGTNQTITLPTNSVNLNGSATDADGTISAYKWTLSAGPSVPTLSSTITPAITITKLVAGTYTFRLTATDDKGATASATVTVTVNAATAVSTKKAPVAKTNGKQTLVGTSISLSGDASTDPDGTITAYNWTQVSGPTQASITNGNKATAQASKLAPGTYVFQLEVTDNDGLKGTADLTLEVSAALGTTTPVARAGGDQSIVLPVNSVNLDGSTSSDPNGIISAFQWTKIAGPGTPAIATASQAKTAVSGLVEGVYSFRLEVTDNDGLKDADTIQVTVKAAAANQAPVAVTNNDLDITQPVDSVSLDGSGSYDNDGTITLYQWKMINGSTQPLIKTPNSAKTTVSNLKQGIYVFQLTIKDDKGALATKEVKVTVRNVNGIVDASAMKIYPNPVQSDMTIRIDNATQGKAVVRIYSMTGVAVFTDQVQNSSATLIKTYNLGNLTAGSYVLSVQFENQPAMIRKFQKL